MPRDGLVDHCLELLSLTGSARSRRMFGGHGLYLDDLFIALIAYDRLYLKADEETRPKFEAAGCEPFRYAKQGGEQAVMAYWSAPEEAMDSPAAMQPWARLAMAAALRARQAQAARPRKPGLKASTKPGSKPGTKLSKKGKPKAPAQAPKAEASAPSAAARPKASARPKR